MICDERQEFEVNLGKAVDTLKKDYPHILTCPPGTLCIIGCCVYDDIAGYRLRRG